ncbi:sensor histidine kinase [Phytomonospora endophytica]|uniref:histidine kinase n=1 Tax=Phytomonospora endophytica TaxID=714109 RepID=A0A841FLB8_9ACTN|nr:sensor histidine kinase [Phytomonospora endophytica]MBB6033419.1 signal transduction histidine kinase [Phytomonospora endophytica]
MPSWILPILVAFFQFVGTAGASRWGHGDSTPQNWLSKVLLLAGPVALLFAGKYPRTVVGVAIGAAAAYYSLGYAPGPIFLSVVASLFLWGRWMRGQRNAERRRARVAEAEQRAGAERLRIAQELHDVLAHHISLINVQAGVALHLVDERPEQTRTALAAIKSASKEALGELRAALDALRNPGDEAPRAPTAGLSELPAIVDSVRAAGLDVRFDVEGEPRELGVATELAALRIVQESLTNVIRHAGATAASVTLAYDEGALRLVVADNGTGGVPVPGNGLSGMRERAGALGGTCTAGPAPGGGFAVRAELPG